MATEECLYLRKRLHELLVDGENAPEKLASRWQAHRCQCGECSRIWEQLRDEQQRGERLLHSLASRLYRPAAGYRSRLKHLALAACVLVAVSLGLLWQAFPGVHRDEENTAERPATARDTIAHAVLAGEHKWGKKFDSGEIDSLTEKISLHIQWTQREFESMSALLDSCEQASVNRHIPFLRLRLKLHCRLALITPETMEKLVALEQNDYPISGIEELFALPIRNIGANPESAKLVADFFQGASPHLLSILRHRRALLHKIGVDNVRDMGGEAETLALIDRIENTIIQF